MAKTKTISVPSVIAKTDDATIQITFRIPYQVIKTEEEISLKEYAKDIEVPGFRKGKAPLDKVKDKIPPASLTQHILGHILPKALAEAIIEHKIKPAIYPKFELLSAKEDEDWQVRAVTCELPEVDLGDYKKIAAKITDPGIQARRATAGKPEKEEEIIKALLQSIKLSLPKILIEKEVNVRLSQLLERIEKLGLSLESYLTSIGKTPEALRQEYELQASDTLKLDLILVKVAQDAQIRIDEAKIDETIKASTSDPKVQSGLNSPEQRRIIAEVLRRRAALDYLTSL